MHSLCRWYQSAEIVIIIRDPTTDRQETRRLGGEGVHNDGGGYSTHLRAVYIYHPWGGFPGAQGQDLSQPGTPGKTVVVSVVDHE